ncbi:MAG TPA: alpha/beta hydrolase [Steroidobacteraceae bacterium]|jgi:pimeloyl-ACP methyl ester carboxylesterase|nr:alpha/beta hydrolase [Steroidobacteraceae bacterium]
MRVINRRDLLGLTGSFLAAQALPGCAVRSADSSARETIDAARFTALRKFARTPFGDVAYVAHGQGRAVLLLHGFPLNGFQWRGAIERLSPYARCIAPDFLGMGHSRTDADRDLGPDSQVSMLASLLNSLGIAQVDLIANDSGGAVAQLFAVRHPTRVRSLLLTNCDTEKESPPEAMRPVIELARQGRFVDEWLAPWHEDPMLARSDRGIGGMCYADRAQPTDEALRMYFGPLIDSPERKSGLHRYALALERNALAGIRAAQQRSRIPVRIVWGIDDTIFDSSNADYLEHSFGNSHGVRRLKNAKLFWPEERPDIIAAQARILWESAPA